MLLIKLKTFSFLILPIKTVAATMGSSHASLVCFTFSFIFWWKVSLLGFLVLKSVYFFISQRQRHIHSSLFSVLFSFNLCQFTFALKWKPHQQIFKQLQTEKHIIFKNPMTLIIQSRLIPLIPRFKTRSFKKLLAIVAAKVWCLLNHGEKLQEGSSAQEIPQPSILIFCF